MVKTLSIVRGCVAVLVALLLGACASMMPGFQQPEVSVTSFTLAQQAAGAAPRFNIGIRVVNPNRVSLPLRGISYAVEIEGNRVLTGAKPDLPVVAGYGTADFVIEAAPDLLGSVRLVSDLLSRQRGALGYKFSARIDIGTLLPLTIEQGGEFGLPAR